MSLHRRYEKATRCSTGPTPGAKALMSWFLGAYQARGGKNLGIFNCRPVRGSTATTSLHGEGRACDFGINPHSAQYGTELADRLRLSSGELGIQCVIWNRRIWSGSYPDAGWRAYSGSNPHVDHLHVELSKASAATLTAARAQQVLGGQTGSAPTARKDNMFRDYHLRGDGTIRIVWPVGRASAVTARAYLSAAVNGPNAGTVRGWFQDDHTGISEFALRIGFRDGHSDRRYVEFPDGATQVNIQYSMPEGGTLAIEAISK